MTRAIGYVVLFQPTDQSDRSFIEEFPPKLAALKKLARKREARYGKTLVEKLWKVSPGLANRPALVKAVGTVVQDPAVELLVNDVGALGLEPAEVAALLRKLAQKGIRVIAACSGEVLTDSLLHPSVLTTQDDTAVRRALKSLMQKAAHSAHESRAGRIPFGEKPKEEATLKQMLLLRRKPKFGRRRSYSEIAAILNEEPTKYPTRQGKPWRAATVRRIIRRVAPSLD